MAWIAQLDLEKLRAEPEPYRMPILCVASYEATKPVKLDTTWDFLLMASTPFLIAIAIAALG